MCVVVCCMFGGLDFGEYVVVVDVVVGVVGYLFQCGVVGVGFVYQFCFGVVVWIVCEQIWLVGQDYQCVGFYQVGDECCKCVVVVELDFFGGDCVVFVDYWDGIELQQCGMYFF